ncbi:MAG: hypothetical protein Q9225_005598 [Loekoesia sp. 1 TL-2023]
MASEGVKNLARNAPVNPVPSMPSSTFGKRSRDEELENALDVCTSPSKRPMAFLRGSRQTPHRHYPRYDFDGLSPRRRQQHQRPPREHTRQAFTNPRIPAIGEEPEDDLRIGIPNLQNSSSREKKRSATEALGEPSTPSSTVIDAASPQSAKRQRTSSSTSSLARSFSESLASMSPSPKKREAMEYKASIKRQELKRASAHKSMGDEHVSSWLDDLRTSALRTPSPCLRREIHNTTAKLRKMKVDGTDA